MRTLTFSSMSVLFHSVRELSGRAAVFALMAGTAAACVSSDLYGEGCFEYTESQRAIDSFDGPLAGMERTPAEVVALHGQAHPIEVVSQADPQVRWDAQVVAVPLDDKGTLRSYDASCPESELFTVPARFEFRRPAETNAFFSVTGALVVSAGAREETLQGWYDAPVEMSEEFQQTFLTEPGLDEAHNFFGLNVHTDPEYAFCGGFKLRKEGETDKFGVYGSETIFRTLPANGCNGSMPP